MVSRRGRRRPSVDAKGGSAEAAPGGRSQVQRRFFDPHGDGDGDGDGDAAKRRKVEDSGAPASALHAYVRGSAPIRRLVPVKTMWLPTSCGGLHLLLWSMIYDSCLLACC